MTDQPQAGSDTSGIPAAGTGTMLEGSGSGGADPFSGLQDAGIREWVGKAGFKDTSVSTFENLAKKARDAESLIGRSVQIPDDKAKPEDLDKFFNRLGRPEKPDGYEFKLPESLPKDFAYDKDRANAFKSWAHQAGLTKRQAQQLHDAVLTADAEALGKAQAEVQAEAKKLQDDATKRALEATQALEKAYGGVKDSDPFKQGVDLAVRALEGLDKLPGVSGIKQAFENAGLLVGGVVLEPSIAVALTHIGNTLFKEGDMPTGQAGGGTNPFADGGNNTEQMHLISQDRARALRLIAQAGRKPEEFGLT